MPQIEYRYLRPKKAETLMQWHQRPLSCKDTLSVQQYTNGVILPLRQVEGDLLAWGRGGVQDSQGVYVEDSGIPRLYGVGYSCEPVSSREEKVVYCGYLVHHWGHFLVDGVTRLWYWFQQDESIDRYVFMVQQGESTELKGNYREFFALLGILDKIEVINEPVRYREVIVPEQSYDRSKSYYTQQYKRIFEEVAHNVQVQEEWTPKERIFLSRSQLEKARNMEAGLDFLDHYFAKTHYTVLYPEKTPLAYMIYLIRHADICASCSGSLPHNMLFGTDGQQILVVERNALNNTIQVDINRIKNLHTIYLDGNVTVYPVELAYGPFIFYYNTTFQQFTEEQGYLPPDDFYRSRRYTKKVFQQYYAAYKDEHRYKWYLDAWMIPHTDSLYEAYQDSERYFGDYLSGRRPFMLHHYFELHYFKQFIKRLIGMST